MSRSPDLIKPRRVTQLLNSARKGRLEANGVEVLPDGTIRLLKREEQPAAPMMPLDAFRARKHGPR